ncbi:MAG: hypothetical protein ACO3EK_16325, partial [Alphaproteobacteria bacterium]
PRQALRAGQPFGGFLGDGGFISDGFISGARVFRDLNNNRSFDAGEPFVFSQRDGSFSGLAGTGGSIVAVPMPGSIDISTGQAFAKVLSAPAGSAVINPLTTLLDAVIRTGVSAAVAQQRIATALGIDPTLNPASNLIAIAAGGGAQASAALQAQAAAAKVANLLVAGASLLNGSGAQSSIEAGARVIIDSLAAKLNAAGAAAATFDISASARVGEVFTAAGVAGGDPNAAALGQAIAQVNATIDQVDRTTGVAGLATIAQSQIFAQRDLAQAATDGTIDAAEAALLSAANVERTILSYADEVGSIVVADGAAPRRPALGNAVTLSGSFAAGDQVTLTIDGIAVAYTVVAADIGASTAQTNAAIAAKLVAAVAADADASDLVGASLTGSAGTLALFCQNPGSGFGLAVTVASAAGLASATSFATDSALSASEIALGLGVLVRLAGSNAVAGSTLQVLVDGASKASVVLGAADISAGAVLVPLGAAAFPLDGSKAITAKVGSGVDSPILLARIDRVAPGAPALALQAGSDSGNTAPDDLTNDDTPTIRVSFSAADVSAGALVTLLSGGASAGTATLTSADAAAGFVDITTSTLGADGVKSL